MAARLLMLIVAALAWGCTDAPAMRTHETIMLGGRPWKMELAMSDAAIARGLMGRTSLPDGEGMLFIFPDNEIRSFWMANCLMDIDLLYLDGRGYIITIHRMKAEPPRADDESELAYQARLKHYWSSSPARFAIEVPNGTIEALSLAPNQKVELDLEGLKELRRRADSRSGP